MKTQSRHSTSAAVLALAALLLLGNSVGLDVAFVCTGSDGRMDVRPGPCACCSEHTSHGDSGDSEPAPASPSCSDCVERPMSVPSIESRGPLLVVSLTDADGRFTAQDSAGDCNTGSLFLGDHMDQHWHSLLPLSTVVLQT